MVWLEGPGDEIVGPFLHRGEGGVLTAVGAHHDHEGGAATLPVGPQELQTAELRHADVAQDEIERLAQRALEAEAAVAFRGHLIAGVAEQQSQGLPQARLVVYHQDAGHTSRSAGRKILKAAPPSRA